MVYHCKKNIARPVQKNFNIFAEKPVLIFAHLIGEYGNPIFTLVIKSKFHSPAH